MKTIPMAVIGGLLCALPLLSQAGPYVPPNGTVNIFQVGDKGTINNAIFAGDEQHVGGTGVFNPFLSLETPNGQTPIERAYNAGNGNLYMDNQRPNWNSQLHIGDLQRVTVNNLEYFLFALDANEPGNDKSYISIDNIRIYTSPTDTSTGVQNDTGTMLNSLGTLRFSMNDPLRDQSGNYIIDKWVDLDSRLGTEPAGSGLYDMLVYVPVSNFAGALDTDFLWFYNLNGVHVNADNTGNVAAQAGFEEWRAFTGPNSSVPDGGLTLALLGFGFACLGMFRSRLVR